MTQTNLHICPISNAVCSSTVTSTEKLRLQQTDVAHTI